MCDFSADEVCSVWVRRNLRARKKHRCECCFGLVAVGEKYVRTFMVFKGQASDSKHCIPCDRELSRFGKEHDYYPHPEQLTDSLQDCIDDGDGERWKRALKRIEKRRAQPVGAA